MYQVIETTLNDGSVALRFVAGSSKQAVKFACEQARRFQSKPGVTGTRVYEASAAEVAALRA